MKNDLTNHSNFDDFGYFWFPENPSSKITGTIKRSKFNQNFTIQLLFSNADLMILNIFNKSYDIILGNLSSIGHITLLFSKVVSVSTNGNCILEAEYLLTNIHLRNIDSKFFLKNIKARVFFDGLSNWKFHNHKELLFNDVNVYGINLMPIDSKSYCIIYKNLHINFDIFFSFSLSDKSIYDLDIRDYSYIEFKIKRVIFDDLITFFKDFKDLLTVLWGFPAIINNIEFNFVDDKYNFNLFMNQYILKDRTSIKSNEKYYPLMLKDIEDNFETIVNKWFELKDDHKMIMDILMEQYYNPFINPNNDFLALCRALESFGRFKYNKPNDYLYFEDWKKIKTDIFVFLENHYKDTDKLNIFKMNADFNDKITFRKVLKFIRNSTSKDLSNLINFNKESIDDMVTCRNELTHKRLHDYDVNSLKLYSLANLVLLSIILKDLTITDDLIYRAISKNDLIFFLKK